MNAVEIIVWDRPPAARGAIMLAAHYTTISETPLALHLADIRPVWEPTGMTNLYITIREYPAVTP